jgi:hypothetical protein
MSGLLIFIDHLAAQFASEFLWQVEGRDHMWRTSHEQLLQQESEGDELSSRHFTRSLQVLHKVDVSPLSEADSIPVSSTRWPNGTEMVSCARVECSVSSGAEQQLNQRSSESRCLDEGIDPGLVEDFPHLIGNENDLNESNNGADDFVETRSVRSPLRSIVPLPCPAAPGHLADSSLKQKKAEAKARRTSTSISLQSIFLSAAQQPSP